MPSNGGCAGWTPALFHGAVNAAITLPLAVCLTDTGSSRLLGPTHMGLLAGLPALALAALLLCRAGKEDAE